VRLAHEDPTATAMPLIPEIEVDWDNLDPSILSKSVVSRLGIVGNAARTAANSNALLLRSYAHSLCMHKDEEGVVTVKDCNWTQLDRLDAYIDIIRSTTVQNSDIFRLKANPMLPFRQPEEYDAEQLIDYAYHFGRQLIIRTNALRQHPIIDGRKVWEKAVGKGLKKDYVRLFSFLEIEQTLWKQAKVFGTEVFANVLSDFIGNINKTRMVLMAPMVKHIIRNRWVSFDMGHVDFPDCNVWEFSTLSFKNIARVFALVLLIDKLPARSIKRIEFVTRNYTCTQR
jgi:hypothetical protein